MGQPSLPIKKEMAQYKLQPCPKSPKTCKISYPNKSKHHQHHHLNPQKLVARQPQLVATTWLNSQEHNSTPHTSTPPPPHPQHFQSTKTWRFVYMCWAYFFHTDMYVYIFSPLKLLCVIIMGRGRKLYESTCFQEFKRGAPPPPNWRVLTDTLSISSRTKEATDKIVTHIIYS